MKIQKLELIAYGPFTDAVLDFSSGAEGLHIVYGPNEAGKSSTLRAIHGLLFGIPAKCTDDQIHNKKQLRIGATLRDSDNKKLRVHRRKGNKNTLLNPKSKKDVPYADNILDSVLCGIDAQTFDRVYGICHDELKKGGEEMRSLRGLVGESLFAATVGGSGLSQLLSDIDAEAGELYSASKRNVSVKMAKRDFEVIKKERREAQLTKSRWEKIQGELDKARKRYKSIVDESSGLEKELSSLRRIESALGFITKRSELQEQIVGLGPAVLLPEQYSSEQRTSKQTDLKHVNQKIENLKATLEGDGSLRQQIAAIDIPEGLLGYADAISELKDQRAVIVKAAKDRDSLQRDCEQLRIQVESLMRDLRLGDSIEDAEKYRIAPEQRTHIQQLGTNEKRLRERPASIRAERAEVESRLEQLAESLERLGEPRNVDDLKRSVGRAIKQGDLQNDVDAMRTVIAKRESEIDQQLAGLGLWRGTVDELSALSLPMSDTVERFDTDFSDTDNLMRSLRKEEKRLRAEEANERQAIAALQNAGHVPTEAELNQLRADREAQWHVLREKAESNDTGGFSDLARTFENAVASADDVADRLRREAERVAQLAEKMARAEGLVRELSEVTKQLAEAMDHREMLERAWQDDWSKSGVANPLPPREMKSWLLSLKEIRSAANSLEQDRIELKGLEQRYETHVSELRERLADVGQSPVNLGLGQLLEQAEDVIGEQDALLVDRKQLESDIKHGHADIEKLDRESKEADNLLETWQGQWESATSPLGCAPDATADQANERLNHLGQLFQHLKDIESKKKRIADIDDDASQFGKDVKRFADQFLNESDAPPEQIVLTLAERVQTAVSERQRLEQLNEELGAAEAKLTEVTEEQQTLRYQLDSLRSMAGADDLESLPIIERGSRQLAEYRGQLQSVEEQLHQLSGNASIDDFAADAKKWDADELSVRISSLEREGEQLKSDRDQAAARVRELENEAIAADGNAESAEKDQEALGLIARMQSDAARYMRLRLAATILRQQIEKHRAENEDPLLQRASTLFARMTCNEFSGIRTDFENDDPVIVGVRKSNDELVPVTAMSTGTRDQLYLALRLGYVERQLVEHEPMPFIVDDILIQFDPDRSRATLAVLAELAKQTQVIFFTHHWHLVELAREGLPADECFVHHLDSRERESSANMASTRPR